MNLVAKEYVASQGEQDPGVLVLSRFAGAAHEMREALIVNPYDEDSVADALSRAILMPQHDVHAWRTEYLEALERPVPAS